MKKKLFLGLIIFIINCLITLHASSAEKLKHEIIIENDITSNCANNYLVNVFFDFTLDLELPRQKKIELFKEYNLQQYMRW